MVRKHNNMIFMSKKNLASVHQFAATESAMLESVPGAMPSMSRRSLREAPLEFRSSLDKGQEERERDRQPPGTPGAQRGAGGEQHGQREAREPGSCHCPDCSIAKERMIWISEGPMRISTSGGTVKHIVPSVSFVGRTLAFSSARITRLSRISAA